MPLNLSPSTRFNRIQATGTRNLATPSKAPQERVMKWATGDKLTRQLLDLNLYFGGVHGMVSRPNLQGSWLQVVNFVNLY